MGIKQRLEDTIDNPQTGWTVRWGDRLKTWASGLLAWAFEIFADVLGKAFAPKLRPLINKIESVTSIPPELKPLFDEVKEPTGEVASLIGNSIGRSVVGGAVGRLMDWLLRPLMFGMSKLYDFHLMDPFQLITLLRRGLISGDEYSQGMSFHGIHPDKAQQLYDLAQVRFPSEVAGLAWLRDKGKYGWLWDDVRANGVDPERIRVLQELAYKIPSVQDVIRFAVREIYTPEIAEEYGQFEDFPELAVNDAERAGYRRDDFVKNWGAHWDLPSSGEGFEMYHRGLITFEQLQKLLRARDVMPFWRDKLTEIAWNLPNRIEIRMMARYGLVDKPFIVDMLKKVGLAEEYRDVAADMMLVMGIRTDFSTRYRNKWINSDQLKQELAESGLSEGVQDRLYKWIVKNAGPARIEDELNLTKSEIIKGVKKDVISWEQGIELLQDKGLDEDEAMFVMAINVEALTGSPKNMAEFKRLTELEKLAKGEMTDQEKTAIVGREKELIKEYKATPPLSEDEVKVKVDTIRRSRRRQEITRDQEIVQLRELGLSESLATSYADNDDMRLSPKT